MSQIRLRPRFAWTRVTSRSRSAIAIVVQVRQAGPRASPLRPPGIRMVRVRVEPRSNTPMALIHATGDTAAVPARGAVIPPPTRASGSRHGSARTRGSGASGRRCPPSSVASHVAGSARSRSSTAAPTGSGSRRAREVAEHAPEVGAQFGCEAAVRPARRPVQRDDAAGSRGGGARAGRRRRCASRRRGRVWSRASSGARFAIGSQRTV